MVSAAMLFLLLLLFLAALLNVYFSVTSKKLYSWIRSFLFKNSSSSSAKVFPRKERATSSCNTSKGELKSVFATFDKNGDGFIAKQELRESLKNIGMLVTEKEVEEMVVKFDSNGDGLIDYEEFCLLCKNSMGGGDEDMGGEGSGGGEERAEEEEEGDLKEAFDVFDRDKDGLISVEELGLVLSSLGLKEGKREEDCKEMIRKVDIDGDGMVNFDEFKRMMRIGRTKLIPVC